MNAERRPCGSTGGVGSPLRLGSGDGLELGMPRDYQGRSTSMTCWP